LELETSNLAGRLTTMGTKEKKCKIRLKAVGKRSRDLHLKFWDTFYISETVGARNFKFGASMQNPNIRDDGNRKYNSNMADVRFLKSEVVITQPWIVLSYRNLLLR